MSTFQSSFKTKFGFVLIIEKWGYITDINFEKSREKKINSKFSIIKKQIKEFLKGQNQFTDYDFEGSSLSILLDLLAYNTHYGALYNNLAVNESFLDSASKRNSVVSLAKALGYVPDSARGAIATITLIVSNTTTNQDILNLPKYTQFSTAVDGQNYIFYTMEDYSARRNTNNNTYTFSEIKIKEGFPLTFKYQVTDGQRYILPNTDVAIAFLFLSIARSNSDCSSILDRYLNLIAISLYRAIVLNRSSLTSPSISLVKYLGIELIISPVRGS
jgi:hypothetical protein